MNLRRALRCRDAVGLTVLTGVYGAGVAELPLSVSPVAWFALYAVSVAAGLGLWRSSSAASHGAARWLRFAAYSLLLAAIFFGADRGLDALKGAQRVRIDVAAALGGLELWLVLFPGATAVALGGWARGLWR